MIGSVCTSWQPY